MATQPQQETDSQISPGVRAAMGFLRHCDMIRAPVAPDAAVPMTGRDLSDREQAAENAALRLLENYFTLYADLFAKEL